MTRMLRTMPVTTVACDEMLGSLYARRRSCRRRIAWRVTATAAGWVSLLFTDFPWWWQALFGAAVAGNVFLVGIESRLHSEIAAAIAKLRTQRSIPYPYRVSLMFVDGLNQGMRAPVIGSPEHLFHLADFDE